MPYKKYSPQEVESRGEQIYEQQIRQNVETGNKGKFVVIDIETAEYAFAKQSSNLRYPAPANRPSKSRP